VGGDKLTVVANSGGKLVLTNIPISKPEGPDARDSASHRLRPNPVLPAAQTSPVHPAIRPVSSLVRGTATSQDLQTGRKPGILLKGELGSHRVNPPRADALRDRRAATVQNPHFESDGSRVPIALLFSMNPKENA
jgi:hypothetical protein